MQGQRFAVRLDVVRRQALALLACGASAAGAVLAQAAAQQRHPDVVGVKVRASGADTFDFDVTISSPYDTPARYADAFRATTDAGQVLAERKLLHDHQNEQPFTRDLHGLKIAPHIKKVLIQARDQKFGYGGKTFEVALPGR